MQSRGLPSIRQATTAELGTPADNELPRRYASGTIVAWSTKAR